MSVELEFPDVLIDLIGEYADLDLMVLEGGLIDEKPRKTVKILIPEPGENIFEFEWKYIKPIDMKSEDENITIINGQLSAFDIFTLCSRLPNYINSITFNCCEFSETSITYTGTKFKKPELNLIFESSDFYVMFANCKFQFSDFIDIKNIGFKLIPSNKKRDFLIGNLRKINFRDYFKNRVDGIMFTNLINYFYKFLDYGNQLKLKFPDCENFLIKENGTDIKFSPVKEMITDVHNILHLTYSKLEYIYEDHHMHVHLNDMAKNSRYIFSKLPTVIGFYKDELELENLVLFSNDYPTFPYKQTIETEQAKNMLTLKIDFPHSKNLVINGPNLNLRQIYAKVNSGCRIEIFKRDFPNLREFIIVK